MATDYTTYIPSLHNDKPKFVAMVGLTTSAFGGVTDSLLSIPQSFDVDTAVGVQLDAVGLWVGIRRVQPIDSVVLFFSWNIYGRGWNQSNWRGPYDALTSLTTLDDDTYRVLLKARIGGNYWGGSQQGLNSIAQSALLSLGVTVTVVDNFDMTTSLLITGSPSNVLLGLIIRGQTPPKSAGVSLRDYKLMSVSGTPVVVIPKPTDAILGISFGHYTP